jgi:hypothetical protein
MIPLTWKAPACEVQVGQEIDAGAHGWALVIHKRDHGAYFQFITERHNLTYVVTLLRHETVGVREMEA